MLLKGHYYETITLKLQYCVPDTRLVNMETRSSSCKKLISERRIAWWLVALLGMFTFRVISQFIASYIDIGLLPGFNDWHSAVLPYPVLLASQIIILLSGLLIIKLIFQNKIKPNPKLGSKLLVLAWVYWFVMLVRLILGLTILNEVHWFSQSLPALFHLLLANILMLVGTYHRHDRQGS